MILNNVWFVLIAVLWIGYFVLEGFDFGVGVLLPVLGGRDENRRRVMINTIGPVWDGNEVWLIVAGGATFAAFPEWYSSLFSGFYLALLLILLALIVRGVAFEYRGKVNSAQWIRRWDSCLVIGSGLPALLWGVAFGNIVRGVPLNADHQFVGNFLDLLNPYALLAGLTTFALFTTHGAVFLALKTAGQIRHDARRLTARLGVITVVLAAGFLLWTQLAYGQSLTWVTAAVAAVSLLRALVLNARGRERSAFAATALTIVAATVTLFVNLYPNVLPSTLDPAGTLNITNAASTPYTLKVMTWVAVFFTPIVLIYESWSYWVFRKRLSVSEMPPPSGLPPRESAAATTPTGSAAGSPDT